jgi:ABC-type phosphate transport system substrate-binding protein
VLARVRRDKRDRRLDAARGIRLHVASSVIQVVDSDYVGTNPDVTIITQATGSGAGIDAIISGTAQIGISDAYLTDEDAERNPQIINIPLAISAQTINYNVPEVGTIR